MVGSGSKPGQVVARIDRLTATQHLVVQVGAGRAPGRADHRDDLARRHQRVGPDEQARRVRITGRQAIAMVDLDAPAVVGPEARVADRAAGRSVDRRAGLRAEIAALWGVDSVPSVPGLPAVAMFDAIGQGKIKAVWIACTNPAHSMPDANAVRAALAGCEFVVLQEAFADTDTAPYADLLLPAAS